MFFQILTANISIGNPPQNFGVTLDTGYADPLLVPSVNCEADGFDGCDERWPHRYNHTKSETFEPNGRKVETELAAYNYHGHLSWDEVNVGDVAIPHVLFHEWQRASCRFFGCIAGGFDGAFGLAPPWVETTVQAPSPLSALFDSEVLDSRSFSLTLPNIFDGAGEITFGISEPAKNARDPVKIPLRDDYNGSNPVASYWPIQFNDLLMNNPDPAGDPLRASFGNVGVSIITSFPGIMLPGDWGTALNNLIGAEDIGPPFHKVPCEKRGTLPPLILGLGPDDQSVAISSWSYIQKFCDPEGVRGCICASMFEDGAEYGIGSDGVVLGHAFLEGFYTTFDADERSVSCKSTLCQHVEMLDSLIYATVAELVYDEHHLDGRRWWDTPGA